MLLLLILKGTKIWWFFNCISRNIKSSFCSQESWPSSDCAQNYKHLTFISIAKPKILIDPTDLEGSPHGICVGQQYCMNVFTSFNVWAGYNTRLIFKQCLTEFSLFVIASLKSPVSPTIFWCPRLWVLCEIQTASSIVWTQITLFISYNDNHYTMSAS